MTYQPAITYNKCNKIEIELFENFKMRLAHPYSFPFFQRMTSSVTSLKSSLAQKKSCLNKKFNLFHIYFFRHTK